MNPHNQVTYTTRHPAWRTVARGTGLPSPRKTSAVLNPKEVTTAQVLKLLQQRPVTSRDIAAAFGIGERGANYHLRKLKDRGMARRREDLKLWVAIGPDEAPARLRGLSARLAGLLDSDELDLMERAARALALGGNVP